ncbi:hypothetical protein H0H93_003987 [Arthromyces matolae]|nr:hypothetical protein H0H93_003987 [Arthromyces matolae]
MSSTNIGEILPVAESLPPHQNSTEVSNITNDDVQSTSTSSHSAGARSLDNVAGKSLEPGPSMMQAEVQTEDIPIQAAESVDKPIPKIILNSSDNQDILLRAPIPTYLQVPPPHALSQSIQLDRPLPPLPRASIDDVRSLPQLRFSSPAFDRERSIHMESNHMSEKREDLTVADRLMPTLLQARTERDACARKAKLLLWSLNIAIGLQILLGALTTGVSATASSSGRETAISTIVLGALSTIVASFLARTRGSNQPELSIVRQKALDHLIRDINAFQLDYGSTTAHEYDERVESFRRRFEEILSDDFVG